MSWEWMDLVTDYLNPDALADFRDTIAQMNPWIQGIMVGAVLLLAGTAFLELLSGVNMLKFARFVSGLAVGFSACYVIVYGYSDPDEVKLLLYSLAVGAAAGALNAFLERAYRFIIGFLFGTAFGTWLVPNILKKELADNPGRIYRLLIAAAAGILFALLAKKMRFVLSALLGSTILGLLIESFVSYRDIPYLPETLELSEGMYRNILPLVLAGIGALIQLPQFISLVRREREMRIPPGEVTDSFYGPSEESTEDRQQNEDNGQAGPAVMNVADAEAALVEKARELALAASKNVEDVRARERYEDVAEGLYSPETAARRLGITEEEFLEGMRQNGFAVPGEEDSPEAESSEEMIEEQEKEDQDEFVREESTDLSEERQTDVGEDPGDSE